jgi:hypothetical protein
MTRELSPYYFAIFDSKGSCTDPSIASRDPVSNAFFLCKFNN